MDSFESVCSYLNRNSRAVGFNQEFKVIFEYLFNHYMDDTDILNLKYYSTRGWLDIKKLTATGTSDKWRKFVKEHPDYIRYMYQYYCLKKRIEEIARCGNKCSHIIRKKKDS